MNDLGWALVWLAIQATVVLIPALILQILASRRDPAAGAWVATWSLALMIVLAPGLAIVGSRDQSVPNHDENKISSKFQSNSIEHQTTGVPVAADPRADDRSAIETQRRSFRFESIRSAFAGLERRAVEPAARLRPWGRTLAVVALAGSLFGLIRLGIGLWAVGHCRRAGRVVVDPSLVALVDELCRAMGLTHPVEIREVADLTTPATAGWRRPLILLPGDWRSWDESERRAVLAHELAHIIRGDYAAGLVARFAVVVHAYHPLVRWMAGRLTLQQELAADAIGAEFAGGRESYLLALSRLVFKQEGRSPSWPARAFLPPKGTLIRRIKMLRTENALKSSRGWSKPLKLATVYGLIALTVGAASWRAPVLADDEPVKPGAKAKVEMVAEMKPVDVSFVPEGMMGVMVSRPAATFRRTGMAVWTLIEPGISLDDAMIELLGESLHVDTKQPGFLRPRVEDIESIVCPFKIRIGQTPEMVGGKKVESRKLHQIEGGGMTLRMVAPFDWLAFLRQWKIELEEVREPRGIYQRIKSPMLSSLGFSGGIYLPDDRTLVYENESWIKQIIARESPSIPAYLRGADWDRVSRDLFAVAIDNHQDLFTKDYDLGRPDDRIVLSLFKGVDRWVIGLADLDAMTVRSEVTGRDENAVAEVGQSLRGLVDFWSKALDTDPSTPAVQAREDRFYKAFLTGLKIKGEGESLLLSSEGAGRLTEYGAILQAKIDQAKQRAQEAESESRKKAEQAKLESKSVK